MMRAILLGLLAGGLAPSPVLRSVLDAQNLSSAKCVSAAAIVAKGRPNEADSWAYAALQPCGSVGPKAFVQGIAKYKDETDIAALEDFMTQVDNWTDASVFQAVTELAMDSTATQQVRVFAVRHLIYLLEPLMLYNYAGLTRKADTTVTAEMSTWQDVGCVGAMRSAPYGSFKGAPLPVDYKRRIRATAASLVSSPTVPMRVRYAALCALHTP